MSLVEHDHAASTARVGGQPAGAALLRVQTVPADDEDPSGRRQLVQ